VKEKLSPVVRAFVSFEGVARVASLGTELSPGPCEWAQQSSTNASLVWRNRSFRKFCSTCNFQTCDLCSTWNDSSGQHVPCCLHGDGL